MPALALYIARAVEQLTSAGTAVNVTSRPRMNGPQVTDEPPDVVLRAQSVAGAPLGAELVPLLEQGWTFASEVVLVAPAEAPSEDPELPVQAVETVSTDIPTVV